MESKALEEDKQQKCLEGLQHYEDETKKRRYATALALGESLKDRLCIYRELMQLSVRSLVNEGLTLALAFAVIYLAYQSGDGLPIYVIGAAAVLLGFAGWYLERSGSKAIAPAIEQVEDDLEGITEGLEDE